MILIETQKEEFNRLKDISIFGKVSNEDRFNGDILFVGLGGVGSSVVCNLKRMMMGNITPEDNIHFLMIDSDIPAMEQTIKDSMDGCGFNAMEVMSIYRPNLEQLLHDGITNNPVHPNLAKWMKEDFPKISIGPNGADANRQVGRLMFSNAYEDIRILLFEKLEDIYSKSENRKLDVILVSGVAGGTGSGILADVAYNIRAFAKSRKWTDFRIGGCLLMPDVLFANKKIYDDKALVDLLNSNGCATMKEVDYYMRIADTSELYTFESTTHKIAIRENIFDVCMLVSGKKDEQGYIQDSVIFTDVAYFLFKLSCNKYIGDAKEDGSRQLLRDLFFNDEGKGYYKVINESDYKIPIREIENICEYEVFSEVYKILYDSTEAKETIKKDLNVLFIELIELFNSKAGEPINISIPGLIKTGQFVKPMYKSIKKGQDNLRETMAKQLSSFEQDIPSLVKVYKNKLLTSLDNLITKYMKKYGPFIVIDIIGSTDFDEPDTGIIAEIQKLEELHSKYHPTGEFSRIIESIKDMVSRKLFAFPSAKRETENGYYDACIKELLATEKTMIMDAINSQDVFGDMIRWLREKVERLNDIYTPFMEDLQNAVSDLSNQGKRVIGYLMKDVKQQVYLPSDYINNSRINEFKEGVIRLMVDNEANIDNGRIVPVKQEMEKVYKNMLVGVGMYAPEKLITVAFSDKRPNLQDINVMFVSATSDRREAVMKAAAKTFVEGSKEKTQKKKLCILKNNIDDSIINKKYISIPDAMPYFSKAVKEILVAEPYNEEETNITMNAGEVAISVDDMFMGVPISMLECADAMQKAYDSVDKDIYFGLHTDEVIRDMYLFPNIV